MDFETGTATWNALSKRLDEFIAAWERGDGPPALSEYLPDAAHALRRISLIELIKVDLECRWQRGLAKRIEDYLAEHPELAADGDLPCDLIYEEYHVRKAAGERVDFNEYRERFPRHVTQLLRMIGLNAPETEDFGDVGSASLHHKKVLDFSPGERIDEFDLLVQLGKGAFGSVFLARQTTMQRLVALKISADHGSEPQTLAQLDHPHIVRVYDQRRVADKKVRLLYMQYAPGGTLQDVVNAIRKVPESERTGRILFDVVRKKLESSGYLGSGEGGPRRLENARWPEVVCRIGIQLASALDYAHRHGVLHRDVKPANVLLAGDGTPKLADFNISFASAVDGATPAAYFGGSLAYMSPEQLEACDPNHDRQPEDLDGRSDLYSLGIMLWEMLYGERPFPDPSSDLSWTEMLAAMIDQRRGGLPAAALRLRDDPELRLRPVLEKCLAPDPDDRYADGQELARDLRLCLLPHARDMYQIPRRSWREWTCRLSFWVVMLASLIPNVIAAVLNFEHNRRAIEEHLPESAKLVFYGIVTTINSLAFPIGLAILARAAWPIYRALRRRDEPLAEPESLRRQALSLGHVAALTGIVLWTVSGPCYPIGLQVFGTSLHAVDWLRFIGSLTVSGLFVAAYPFFFVTFLAVRAFVPALLRRSPGTPEEENALTETAARANVYFFLAGGVPLLSVGLLVLDYPTLDTLMPAMMASIASFVGLLLIWRLHVAIRRDLAALLLLVSPPDAMHGLETDTVKL